MILFISASGESLPLAWRIRHEGHPVEVYIHNIEYKRIYSGIVSPIPISLIKKTVSKADVVVFDGVRPNRRTKQDLALLKTFKLSTKSDDVFGVVADVIRPHTRVIGASAGTSRIELDRILGSEVAKDCGFELAETHDFGSLRKGAEFLGKNSDRLWVLKPHGNLDLDLTYVESYPGELADKFEHELPTRIGGDKLEFMLQAKVDGVEVSSEAWWNGDTFLHYNHTFEDKKFLTGHLGPGVGSANNVVVPVFHQNQIFQHLVRLAPRLKEWGYVGPVDVNCIVGREDHRPYFLEWTPRFGWDALYLLLALLDGKLGDFFLDNFAGRFAGVAAGVRISIPPYPYADTQMLEDYAKDVPIKHRIGDFPNVWWEDVYQDDSGYLACTGADGILGVVTGVGKQIGEAVGRVYGTCKKLRVGANLQYRTDCGKRAEQAYRTLQAWGY